MVSHTPLMAMLYGAAMKADDGGGGDGGDDLYLNGDAIRCDLLLLPLSRAFCRTPLAREFFNWLNFNKFFSCNFISYFARFAIFIRLDCACQSVEAINPNAIIVSVWNNVLMFRAYFRRKVRVLYLPALFVSNHVFMRLVHFIFACQCCCLWFVRYCLFHQTTNDYYVAAQQYCCKPVMLDWSGKEGLKC